MEKILRVATAITNPYSLLALTYLILFLLFHGVLDKTGVQEGQSGFAILNYLMTLVAGVSVLTLLSVFGLRAYEVYRQSDLANTVHSGVEDLRNEILSAASPDLQVEFFVTEYTGANILIGNRGQGVVVMSALTINWGYRRCSQFREPTVGAPLVEFRYEVNLTTSDGLHVLDSREFKYGPGDVDKFLVDLHFPELGIYTIWMSFRYRYLGKRQLYSYETPKVEREICVKWR